MVVGLIWGLGDEGNPMSPAHCKGSEGWELSQTCALPPT